MTGSARSEVGPVQVAYEGTAHILDVVEDDNAATVTVSADGREIGGQGAVKASVALTIAASGAAGSTVSIDTDFTVTGRVAQFGRGAIEDISRRLIGQMAEAMGSRLQQSQAAERSA